MREAEPRLRGEARAGCAALVTAVLAACATSAAGGIHAKMGYSKSGGLRVVEVPRQGPAWEAGLRPGDRIVAVDGVPVRKLSMRETVELLRGRAGTKVELRVQRRDGILEMDVRRKPYRRF